MGDYRPIIITRYRKVELIKEIERRCLGKDPEWEMIGEIKHIKSDRPIFFESFNKAKRPRRKGHEVNEKFSVALRKIR